MRVDWWLTRTPSKPNLLPSQYPLEAHERPSLCPKYVPSHILIIQAEQPLNPPHSSPRLRFEVRVTLAPVRTLRKVRSSGDEQGIWYAALTDDANAFVVVFDLHHNRVYRHSLRMTGNVHDAEDVTAATFLELWRRRKSVRVVDGSVVPWLLLTATNLSRNLERGLRRHRALIGTLPRAETAKSAADVAIERIEEERLGEDVRQALASLSVADAALLTLTMYEDYSPSQVAAALGISDGAARTRLHRARNRIAAVLGPKLSHDWDATAKEETR
jgi:RNA polymerase sigma factor (sigma-70 family)